MEKIALVFGTRPEIIKLSQIIKILEESRQDYVLIHTGQHFSKNMSDNFFSELNLPQPKYNEGINGGDRDSQLTRMTKSLKEIYKKEKPRVVIVQGDTNSVLAGAIAAKEIGIKVAHVEAGIRSFDLTMPEEKNRIETDKISDFCFAPTETAVKNLESEGIDRSKIYMVGNTIVEAVKENMNLAHRSKILETYSLKRRDYVVATLHRAENVDSEEKLKILSRIVDLINNAIILPMHPRTLNNLKRFNLLSELEGKKNLKIVEPIGYLDFLALCMNSKLIITDSGGIQEECSIYKKPVIILRENTERPEIIGKLGWLTGFDITKISEAIKIANTLSDKEFSKYENIYGDGSSSRKILEILESQFYSTL